MTEKELSTKLSICSYGRWGFSFREIQRARILCKRFIEEMISEGGWRIGRGRGRWTGCGFSWRAAGTCLTPWMLWSLHPAQYQPGFQASLEWLCLSSLGEKLLRAALLNKCCCGMRAASREEVCSRLVKRIWAQRQQAYYRTQFAMLRSIFLPLSHSFPSFLNGQISGKIWEKTVLFCKPIAFAAAAATDSEILMF